MRTFKAPLIAALVAILVLPSAASAHVKVTVSAAPTCSVLLNVADGSTTFELDFPHPTIGKQAFHFDAEHDNFARKIAPARTFGFMRDVEKLRAAGLARGGSVENCIVLDERGVVNGPLRFRDEFVRHKILDLYGDLALIGRPVVGEITAHRAGHALHSRFVAKVLAMAAMTEEGLDSAASSETVFA